MARGIDQEGGIDVLLMGNEAIARGALEAGVQVVAAYPGTPSSEVVETLSKVAQSRGLYVEWSVNEKVALEVAAAASFAGLRISLRHEAERGQCGLRFSPPSRGVRSSWRDGPGGLR